MIRRKLYLQFNVNLSPPIVRLFFIHAENQSTNRGKSSRGKKWSVGKCAITRWNEQVKMNVQQPHVNVRLMLKQMRKKFLSFDLWFSRGTFSHIDGIIRLATGIAENEQISNKFTITTEAIHRLKEPAMTIDLSWCCTSRNIDSWIGSAIWASHFPNRLYGLLEGIVTCNTSFNQTRIGYSRSFEAWLSQRVFVHLSERRGHRHDALEFNLLGASVRNRHFNFWVKLRKLDSLEPFFDLLTSALLETRQTHQPINIHCCFRHYVCTISMTTWHTSQITFRTRWSTRRNRRRYGLFHNWRSLLERW